MWHLGKFKKVKGTGKWIYIVLWYLTLKVLRDESHSFFLQLHQCLLLPRKHSPDGTSTD